MKKCRVVKISASRTVGSGGVHIKQEPGLKPISGRGKRESKEVIELEEDDVVPEDEEVPPKKMPKFDEESISGCENSSSAYQTRGNTPDWSSVFKHSSGVPPSVKQTFGGPADDMDEKIKSILSGKMSALNSSLDNSSSNMCSPDRPAPGTSNSLIKASSVVVTPVKAESVAASSMSKAGCGNQLTSFKFHKPLNTNLPPVPVMQTVFTVPIEALTPYYSSRWTLVCRVVEKSDRIEWNNNKGEGCLFSCELMDCNKSTVKAVFFKEACDKFFAYVQKGKVRKN